VLLAARLLAAAGNERRYSARARSRPQAMAHQQTNWGCAC